MRKQFSKFSFLADSNNENYEMNFISFILSRYKNYKIIRKEIFIYDLVTQTTSYTEF